MTQHKPCLKTFSVSLLALCTAACSSVPQDGVIATDMTGSFSQMWSNVFTGELRRAPAPQYVFGGTDASLNTALLRGRVEAQQTRQVAIYQPQTMQKPMQILSQPERRSFKSRVKSILGSTHNTSYQRSRFDGFETMRPEKNAAPESAQKSAALPAITDMPRPAQSQPVFADPQTQREAYPSPQETLPQDTTPFEQQSTSDSLSYVKMGGGSKLSDWKACEAKAGTYYLPTATGFIVEPNFDLCMRGLGYKPEAEAEIELSAQAQQ